MNIESLRYFVTAVETGSLSKASEQLYVSQQGLSKAIKSLERSFGIPLVVRSSRGITTTIDGEDVLDRAKDIVERYDAMLGEIETRTTARKALSGEGIKLIASLISIVTILNELQSHDFLEKLVLRQSETAPALQSTGTDDWLLLLDLPSHRYALEELEATYEVFPIFEAKMGILAHRDFLPTLKETITVTDAAKLPLGIVGTETTRDIHEHLFSEHPLENVKLVTTNEHELVRGVKRGRFAALTLSCHWKKFAARSVDAHRYAFAELESDLTIPFAFLRKRLTPTTEAECRFIEAIVHEVC